MHELLVFFTQVKNLQVISHFRFSTPPAPQNMQTFIMFTHLIKPNLIRICVGVIECRDGECAKFIDSQKYKTNRA